jgi:DNA-directed RNA polymerase subunit RPC12/RpoP
MNAIIVTCAGCGKRFKGASATKKFKCSDCANLFTFPDAPHSPIPSHSFCTHCWTEVPQDETLKACPNCNQKMRFGIAGKAMLAGSGAVQHVNVTPAHGNPPADNTQAQLAAILKERDALLEVTKEHEKTKTVLLQRVALAEASKGPAEMSAEETAKWELQMQIGELNSKLAALQNELDSAVQIRDDALSFAESKVAELEALAAAPGKSAEADAKIAELEAQTAKLMRERDDALEGMSQAKFNLDRYREAAVAALEPLGQEYSRAMKELMAESESMLAQLHEQHRDSHKRMEEQINTLGANMRERMRAVRRQMAERLSQVLGTPAEQSLAQIPAVDDTTETKTAAETAA